MNPKVRDFFANVPGVPFLWVLHKKVKAYPWFYKDFFRFRKMNKTDGRFTIRFRDRSLQLLDKTKVTRIEPHYTYHPAWAARVLAETMPEEHIDISSYLPFNTLVSAFIPTKFYDYRPAEVTLDNLTCGRADLTQLDFADNSIKSLSCMHTIEHIGLGRYGDPIDPQGDKKAAKELSRVLAVGGDFLFVAPMGKTHLAFNAHRRYSYQDVLDLFPDLTVKEFSLIPDSHKGVGVIRNADPAMVETQKDPCGCFWFTKEA